MRNIFVTRERVITLIFFITLFVTEIAWSSVLLPDFTDLVEKNSPAVVNISTTQKVEHPKPRMPHGNMPESPFDDFFKKFFGDRDGIQEYDAKSLGSGFIISEDGYILTNNHVIKDADEVIVRLTDRREIIAEVIGADERSDVALLKIEAESLPVAKIGQSSALKVGSWVLAIGSPFGFDHTVTAGIVSAMGRSLPNENYVPFIQTDVAINPGNSGGPLINLDGEVVGVNSQIYSRTGGFMGLSFAIPIDMAMNIVEQLESEGHVTRGWLGILIQDVTRELAESFDMPKPTGALVARVLPDGPAEAAGLKVGDIIVEFDGKDVVRSSALPPLVGSTPVNKEVKVKVIREGKTKVLGVTIAELPDEDELQLTGSENKTNVKIKRLNIVVSELTDDQKQELENVNGVGVVVNDVKSGPGAKAGLRKGDVILKINNVNVENVIQLKDLIAELPAGKSVPMLVQRRSGPIFLAIRIKEED
ncbi:MAG: DegQ family serine endoprotease [Gammaproteobacteria bacterium]